VNVQVKVVGIVRLPDSPLELRFIRTEDADELWKPDLVVNHERGDVFPPPECFKPTTELLQALEEGYRKATLITKSF
jgi:hypothetical protein